MSGVEARWNRDSLDLTLPAGLTRDQLIGVLVERVPPDARLAGAADGGLVVAWESTAPGPVD